MPGFKVIAIVTDNALVVTADPRIAGTGDDVTLSARTRGTGIPVEGVDLYIMEPRFFVSKTINLKEIVAKGLTPEQMAIDNGIYIGTTDENGRRIYQFQEMGLYLVVGIEDGYLPGIATVYVGQFGGLRQLLPLPQIQCLEERLGLKWDQSSTQDTEKRWDFQEAFPRLKRLKANVDKVILPRR
jgi:hypothetical protein